MARNLRVSATLDLRDRLSSQMRRAGRSVRRFSEDFGRSSRVIDRASRGLRNFSNRVFTAFGTRAANMVRKWFLSLKISAAIGAAALSAFAVQGINQAAEFEQTLRNTSALIAGAADPTGKAGPTPAEAREQAQAYFEEYERVILQMAPKLGQKPQGLAEGIYDIVSGGFEDPGSAQKVLEAATKSATAGQADPAIVTNALVQILKSYNMEAEDAMSVSDMLFQTVNFGIIEFEELAEGIGNVVGLANMAGVSIEELGAALIVMTRRGLGPEEAFTSLNRTILSIVAPANNVKDALVDVFGSEAAVQENFSAMALQTQGLEGVMGNLLEILEPTAQELKNLENASSEEAAQAAVQRLAEARGMNIETLTTIFPNVRALRGALLLAADAGDTYATAMGQMALSTGATDRAFEEQSQTMKFAKDQMMSNIDVLKMELGSELLPPLAEGFKGVSGWIQENILGDEEFRNAEGMDKFRRLGEIIWGEVVGWWERHKQDVTTKISEFFSWLGDTAVPFVVDAGFNLGKELVPAIIDGMLATPEGTIAAVFLGGGFLAKGANAAGLLGGAGAGGAGAGGVGAGGAGLGAIGKLQVATLTVASLVLAAVAVKELWDTWHSVEGDLQEMEDRNERDAVRRGQRGELSRDEWEGLVRGAADTTPAQRAAQGIGLAGSYSEAPRMGLLFNEVYNEMLPAIEQLASVAGTDRAREVLFRNLVYNNSRDATNGLTSAAPELADLFGVDKDMLQLQRPEDLLAEARPFDAIMRDLPSHFHDLSQVAKDDLIWAVDNVTTSADGLVEKSMLAAASIDEQARSNEALAAVWENHPLRSFFSLYALANTPEGGAKLDARGRVLERGRVDPSAGAKLDPRGRVLEEGPVAPSKKGLEPKLDPRGRVLEWGGGMAKGGVGTVRRPTYFLAGEAGPEDFAFAPRSKGGMGAITAGGGGGTVVQVSGPLVQVDKVDADTNIEEIADRLVDALEQRAGVG